MSSCGDLLNHRCGAGALRASAAPVSRIQIKVWPRSSL